MKSAIHKVFKFVSLIIIYCNIYSLHQTVQTYNYLNRFLNVFFTNYFTQTLLTFCHSRTHAFRIGPFFSVMRSSSSVVFLTLIVSTLVYIELIPTRTRAPFSINHSFFLTHQCLFLGFFGLTVFSIAVFTICSKLKQRAATSAWSSP